MAVRVPFFRSRSLGSGSAPGTGSVRHATPGARSLRGAIAAGGLAVLIGCGGGPGQVNLTPDHILHNGQIITVDDAFTVAQAIAFRIGAGGSEILAVGTDAEILELRGPNTEVTDLGGRVVIPGIIDSHLHFSLLGIEAEFETDLRYAMRAAEVVQLVDELRARRDPAPGEWLVARGWDEHKYERPFTRWELDEVTPDNPLELGRVYRGIAFNTAALEQDGIRDEDPNTWPDWWLEDPDWFDHEDRIFRELRTVNVEGEARELEIPTGMFLGEAVRLVQARAPQPDFEDQVQAVEYGSREMTSLGVTSVLDPGGGRNVMRAYQEAYRRGLLHFRIAQVYEGFWNSQPPEVIDAHFASLPFNNLGDRFLRWRGTKWQIDGGAGTRSSWVTDPFEHWHEIEGEPNHGYHWVDHETREAQLRATIDRGWEPHVHSTGDLGMRQTLDLYMMFMDSIRTEDPDADLRWSIIHAYLPMEEDTHMLREMAEYDVIAAVNPSFIYHQGRSFSLNLGEERMGRLMPFRSYQDAGVRLAVGSDYGTSPYSPWIGLYALLTRKDLWGGVHNDAETLELEEAIRAMTINNAYLMYMEDWNGSLEPGKVADLVVLDLDDFWALERDPELILEMDDRVLLTLVDGKPSFQRQGFGF